MSVSTISNGNARWVPIYATDVAVGSSDTYAIPSGYSTIIVEYGYKNNTQSYLGGTVALPVNGSMSKPCVGLLTQGETKTISGACVVYLDSARNLNLKVSSDTVGATNGCRFRVWAW